MLTLIRHAGRLFLQGARDKRRLSGLSTRAGPARTLDWYASASPGAMSPHVYNTAAYVIAMQ